MPSGFSLCLHHLLLWAGVDSNHAASGNGFTAHRTVPTALVPTHKKTACPFGPGGVSNFRDALEISRLGLLYNSPLPEN